MIYWTKIWVFTIQCNKSESLGHSLLTHHPSARFHLNQSSFRGNMHKNVMPLKRQRHHIVNSINLSWHQIAGQVVSWHRQLLIESRLSSHTHCHKLLSFTSPHEPHYSCQHTQTPTTQQTQCAEFIISCSYFIFLILLAVIDNLITVSVYINSRFSQYYKQYEQIAIQAIIYNCYIG